MMANSRMQLLIFVMVLLLLHGTDAVYNVSAELRSPLKAAYRTYTASFIRNDTLYFWGGTGRRTTKRTYRELTPYFEYIQFDPGNGAIIYSTVPNSEQYANYSAGANAILLPDNERVLFFGGSREMDRSHYGNGPMNLEQYDFRTTQWTSLPVVLSPSVNTSLVIPPRNRMYMSATLASNGKVYVSGGWIPGNITDLYDMWEYDPDLGLFRPIEQGGLFDPNIGESFYPYHSAVALSDGRIVYVTHVSNNVTILDTNTDQVIYQEVGGYDMIIGGGIKPEPSTLYSDVRYSGHVMLGCAFYGFYQQCRNDIAILDTVTWRWIPPITINDDPPKARFACTGGIINNRYMIVTHGWSTTMDWFNDFNVLRLPEPDWATGHFAWVTNITNDAIISDHSVSETMEHHKSLSVGDIAGIVIACMVIMIAITLVYGRWRWNILGIIKATWKYLLFDPRLGEPNWAEILHLSAKVILSGLFAAYLAYNITFISNSPAATLSLVSSTEQVPFPDIRFCFEGFAILNYFYCESDTMTTLEFVEKGFVQQLNVTGLAPMQTSSYHMNGTMACMMFTPSESFRMNKTDSSKGGKLRFLFDAEPADMGEVSVHVELYPYGRNPNLVVYSGIEQPHLSQQELDDWLRVDFNDMQAGNRYKFEFNTHTSIAYQMQTRRYLTDATWNSVGFASIYESSPELVTTFQTSMPNNDSLAANTIDIYPINMVDIVLQEQRIYTLFTVVGPAAGLFSLLIACDNLLFGARPKSPWGVIHRFSMGRMRTSLQEKLYEKFGVFQQPIPFVDPVLYNGDNQQAQLTPGEARLEARLRNTEAMLIRSERSHQKLEQRLQLTENLFKAYYIDDEVFFNLHYAHGGRSTIQETPAADSNEAQPKPRPVTRLLRRIHPSNLRNFRTRVPSDVTIAVAEDTAVGSRPN